MDILTSGADIWLTLNGKPLQFQGDNENEEANAAENRDNLFRTTSDAPDNLQICVDNELLETERYGRWYWRPTDFAGLYQVEVLAPGYLSSFTTTVRVHPRKISAQRYTSMLTDISQFTIDLLFSLHSPARVKATSHSRDKGQSALREFQLVQHIMCELALIMACIRRNPYRILQRYTDSYLLHEMHHFSNEAYPIPGPLVAFAMSDTTSYLPLTWAVQQNSLTYDVYENRLLKHFIQHQLMAKIKSIQQSIDREMKLDLKNRDLKRRKGWEDDETSKIEALKEMWNESQSWARKCMNWQGETFLKGVRTSLTTNKISQFLLKNPDYNRFYRLYLQFQQELKLNLDADNFLSMLALRKLSELYEIWSIFQLTSLIIDLLSQEEYTITSSNLFYEIEKDRFQVEVKKNSSSIVLSKNDKHIEIKYEPVYKKNSSSTKSLISLYNDQLTPDIAVEIYIGDLIQHVIIFDAKYKCIEQDGEYYPKEEDINKMSWYRDAIRYWIRDPHNPTRRPNRIVSSAYILYPGTYLQHISEEPELGALPMIPDMQTGVWVDVENAVKDILWFADVLQ